MSLDNRKHRVPLSQSRSLTNRAIVVHIGDRIRSLRKQLGMSQSDLGELIGVRFQQVQKYENGANRVSAAALYELACALGVPIIYFFEGLSPRARRRARTSDAPSVADPYGSHKWKEGRRGRGGS
jgi:transcriptional regulator with XRE-family HTH domain